MVGVDPRLQVTLQEPDQFFNAIIDSLCGQSTSLPPNLSVEKFKEVAVKSIVKISSKDHVEEQLLSEGLTEDTAKNYSAVIWARRDELRRALTNRSFRSCAPALKSFDWKLQQVMASSMLSNQSEVLLQLQFLLEDASALRQSSTVLEFTAEELDDFISTLENIKRLSAI